MSEEKTIKTSPAQLRANAKYDKEHMKSYTVKMPKELYSIMQLAFSENEKYKNQNAYTLQAVREKLERDGFLTVGTGESDGK